MGIAGIHTEVGSWRYVAPKGKTGVQIDLLLDRSDHCINICEIKFSVNEYVIDKEVAEQLDHKIEAFLEQTKIRKTIFATMITTKGTKHNIYYTGRIVKEITMKDLFK